MPVGPTTFARIGVMRALNRHHVQGFNPSRKEHHWGRRKLCGHRGVDVRPLFEAARMGRGLKEKRRTFELSSFRRTRG
jgi:hypothetical protein